MRIKSHKELGKYLVNTYMPGIERKYIRAFLFGCVEPDQNPVTYIKGSWEHQWMRGHNYRNAYRCMHKICSGLEGKSQFSLLDYYRLGKLIHYTADAFTQAHNQHFPSSLRIHRKYEEEFHLHFLKYLATMPYVNAVRCRHIMDAIYLQHKNYLQHHQDIVTDTFFVLSGCSSVLRNLSTGPAAIHHGWQTVFPATI